MKQVVHLLDEGVGKADFFDDAVSVVDVDDLTEP